MDTSVTRYIFPHCTVSAVARASREARPPVKIYNFTSGNSVPLKWGEIYGFAEHHLFQVDIYNIYNYIYNICVFFFLQNPLEGMVWYPEGSFKRSVTINRSGNFTIDIRNKTRILELK